jgi:hypothetical protein
VVGYQCFRGPCSHYLQGEANGPGKEDTHIGREYKRGYSLCEAIANKEGWQAGKEGCGVPDHVATGPNWPGEESSSCQ